MSEPTTQERARTGLDPHEGTPARVIGVVRRRPGLVSLAAGGTGIVVALLPGLGLLALALAALSIGAGVPGMRRGPGAVCFPYARTGVVLGMIAVLLGFVSLAMQLLD